MHVFLGRFKIYIIFLPSCNCDFFILTIIIFFLFESKFVTRSRKICLKLLIKFNFRVLDGVLQVLESC